MQTNLKFLKMVGGKFEKFEKMRQFDTFRAITPDVVAGKADKNGFLTQDAIAVLMISYRTQFS